MARYKGSTYIVLMIYCNTCKDRGAVLMSKAKMKGNWRFYADTGFLFRCDYPFFAID